MPKSVRGHRGSIEESPTGPLRRIYTSNDQMCVHIGPFHSSLPVLIFSVHVRIKRTSSDGRELQCVSGKGSGSVVCVQRDG